MKTRAWNLLAGCLVAGAGLGLAVPAHGAIGTLDAVPAATLLLPYFEVNLTDPTWQTTLFSVNNAAEVPAIAHVTLWTDLSVPTLDFNIYLTGYDVATVNLRDLFELGVVPATSHNDPSVSNVGDFSALSNPVTGVGPGSTSCNGQLPLPPLPAVLLEHIRAAHTGQPSAAVFGGLCSGVDHGDNVARGYITIDSVSFCTLDFPGDTGYFIAGGNGAANNQNVLWGDYFYVNAFHEFAQGNPLVHLEASDDLGAGNYTFYRRYSGGADQREGLGSTFASRFATGGAFSGGTELIVWRDSKRAIAPFSCALTAPLPFPLGNFQIVVFDEEENPSLQPTTPFSPPLPGVELVPFPWEANRVEVNGTDFPVPFAFGWLYLNLNTAVQGSQVPFEPLTQNFVATLMSAEDRFSVGFDAIELANVTDPLAGANPIIPFCDGPPDPVACQ